MVIREGGLNNQIEVPGGAGLPRLSSISCTEVE